MKDTHLCPRCQTSTVVHIPGPTGRDGVPLCLYSRVAAFSVHTKASLDAYVCSSCGYLEYYVLEPAELLEIPGATQLPPKPEAPPFR